MSAHPDRVSDETLKPIHELFSSGVTAFWATTYSVDLHLFNEYLLPRLADPPLNVVVLADHHRLSTVLQRIPPEQAETLAAVNRKWLLRGISPSGGVFHPKTYLSVHSARAVLLVGSGNLSASGLSDGREVFTVFRSGTPSGDAAIRTWHSWMRQLVEFAGDTMVAERFRVLESTLAVADWPASAPATSPLLHNLERPIADQLFDRVHTEQKGVDQLLLTAPFFDADAAAVGRLLELFNPRQLALFVTKSTSVNGKRLQERLDSLNADVRIAAYQPDQFVHAKLVGVISGGHGWLMSGSPNLSRAALTLSAEDQGNIELATLSEYAPDTLREVFQPPNMTIVVRDVSHLESLTFSASDDVQPPPVRLLRAALTESGVEVATVPDYEQQWLLDDLQATHPLVKGRNPGTAHTTEPIDGRLVQIVNTDGDILSNRVVADDPASLARSLRGGDVRPDRGIPAEFNAGDTSTPLGKAIAWLHRNMVMDVSESTSGSSTGGIENADGEAPEDDDLWERLEKEELGRDPRAGIYSRLWRSGSPNADEPLIELLEAFGARAPTQRPDHASANSVLVEILRLAPDVPTGEEPDSSDSITKDPLRWTEATRIRVRARNVLRRWADAQTDPRLTWVDPLAPAGNFQMVTAALAFLRFTSATNTAPVELTADDLDELWLRWLRSFAGTGTGDGWLDRLEPTVYDKVRNDIARNLAEAAAALCWLTIRRGLSGRRERIINSQAVIAAALAHGLLDPTDVTAQFLAEVTGTPITRNQIDQELLAAIDYIDDDLWCKQRAQELGLSVVRLQPSPGAAEIKVRIDVAGIDNPLIDPRVPRLAVGGRLYRKCDGIAIYSTDKDWRVVLPGGGPIDYLPARGRDLFSTPEAVTNQQLEALSARAGVLADLFPAAVATA
jgi:hypothetical protein